MSSEFVCQSNTEHSLECSICLQSICSPTVLDCSHQFCSACISKWTSQLKENQEFSDSIIYTCPICRSSYNPSKLKNSEKYSIPNILHELDQANIVKRMLKMNLENWKMELKTNDIVQTNGPGMNDFEIRDFRNQSRPSVFQRCWNSVKEYMRRSCVNAQIAAIDNQILLILKRIMEKVRVFHAEYDESDNELMFSHIIALITFDQVESFFEEIDRKLQLKRQLLESL